MVLEGRDERDCGSGLRGQSNQCWCYIPPSENNSGRKCLLPLSRFSTHLHPSPINCLLYLHLAAATKWMFALKGRNVSLSAPLHHFFLSILLSVYCCLLRLFQCFSLSFMYFSLPSFHVRPRSSFPSSPPLSPPLRNAEMEIIGEVSKMQIVWVSNYPNICCLKCHEFLLSLFFSLSVLFPAWCEERSVPASELLDDL